MCISLLLLNITSFAKGENEDRSARLWAWNLSDGAELQWLSSVFFASTHSEKASRGGQIQKRPYIQHILCLCVHVEICPLAADKLAAINLLSVNLPELDCPWRDAPNEFSTRPTNRHISSVGNWGLLASQQIRGSSGMSKANTLQILFSLYCAGGLIQTVARLVKKGWSNYLIIRVKHILPKIPPGVYLNCQGSYLTNAPELNLSQMARHDIF